jgi:site-specific DNA recombinase
MATVQEAELLEVIVDGGESGQEPEPLRPARLIALVNSSRVNAVIICKLEQLTRSVKDLYSLLGLFEQRGRRADLGCEIVGHGLSPGRLVITIMAAVSR